MIITEEQYAIVGKTIIDFLLEEDLISESQDDNNIKRLHIDSEDLEETCMAGAYICDALEKIGVDVD